MNPWVYDIETYPNIFTFVFREVTRERNIKIFEISSRRNDKPELISFLKQKGLTLIGYNNVYFDYPILHQLLKKPNITLTQLYNFVQDKLINDSSDYRLWESDHLIPQVDVYLIWHYNNRARNTSLKWLEFSLRWKKVQDLPFKPGYSIPEDRFDDLIKYNINDVDFTYYFTGKSLSAILFRQNMSKQLGHNVMNYPDVKIGEYMNRISYAKRSGLEWKSFKNARTHRNIFHLKDIIPKGVEFKTQYMKNFLTEISGKSFTQDEEFNRYLKIGGVSIKFAKGGLHSEDTPRQIKCKEGHKLKEKDIGSMYPWTIYADGIYPEHLGPEWNESIKHAFDYRAHTLKPAMKKAGYGTPEYKKLDDEQAVYKLSMNGGGFGKLGSEYSWQFDNLAKFKVTIGGELKFLMLIEAFSLIPDVEIISVNTDGVVIHYPLSAEAAVEAVHVEWEKKTTYILEDTSYKQIIFSSVNDYIAEIIDEDTKETIKLKFKGDFEVDKDYHKNNSQRIVPLAIRNYFIDGTPVMETLVNHKDIFDFCIGRKGTKQFEYTLVKGDDRITLPDKVVRYYIASNGYKMYKLDTHAIIKDSKYSAVNKGFKVNPFMDYKEQSDYDIDYNYYLNECNKIIKPIEIGTRRLDAPTVEQLSIFDLGA